MGQVIRYDPDCLEMGIEHNQLSLTVNHLAAKGAERLSPVVRASILLYCSRKHAESEVKGYTCPNSANS